MKRNFISVTVSAVCLLSINLNALTLKDSVAEVLDTNPVVQERLKNFNEVQQDLEIAKSEWLPSLDYSGRIGRNNSGDIKDPTNPDIQGSDFDHTVGDSTYSHYSNSLKLTQNIFNGFSTTHKINYQETRVLGAAYNYIENANDIAFQMVGAYIDVIRAHQLYQNAKDNVDINEKIYSDVKSLYDQGLTTKSEMTKIYASLSLANSNLVVQRNNTMDKEFRFKRIFGRDAKVSELTTPALDYAMPESKERATMIAMQNNPSLLVSNYNIKGAQETYKQKKSAFMPTVDVELEQVFNDYTTENNYDSADDRQKAYLVMNWNLYKGGAHAADLQKSKSSINREVELQRDLKRQTIEGLELSWSAYEMLGKQLEELFKYYNYSEETLESYRSEYEMGRRTLLDLLSAQNDLVNSKSQIINAQMDKLFAQYRILDAMGMLVSSVLDESEYNKIIKPTINPFDIVEDELPVNRDVDKDGIVDDLDICDNSVVGNNDITPYGCSQQEKDTDFDGIADSKDRCPNTQFGSLIDGNGCELDGENENAFKTKDDYLKSVVAYTENSPKKSEKLGLYDYEFNVAANKNIKSTALDNHLMYDNFTMIKRFEFVNMEESREAQIEKIANEITPYNDKNVVVTIIGNTECTEDKAESLNKGLKYANTIKNELMNKGIKENIIVTQSRADYDKAYTGKESLNNVVAVALYVPKNNLNSNASVNDLDGDGIIDSLDKCAGTPAGYMVNEDGCTNSLNLEILFENNSAKVKENTKEKVLAFANYLINNKEFNTIITGHASKDRSSAAYNKKLSQARADTVKSLLVAAGVEYSRIQTVGKGYDEPIADNSTAEGQAKNRRIEAILIKK